MLANQPSKDQLNNWLDDPVTQYYFGRLKAEREEALLRLADGVFSAEPHRQNIAIGLIAALTKQLNAEIVED